MTDPKVIWIIMYNYFDNSDFGVIDRAFTDEEEARWQTNLLIKQDCGRTYSLLSIEVKAK